MDLHINPPQLRFKSFGEVDRYTHTGQGLMSGLFKLFKTVTPFIKSAFSKAAPLAKAVLKNKIVKDTVGQLGDQALKAGLNVTKNVLAGENVADGLKQDITDAGKIGLQGLSNLTSSYTSPKKKRKKSNPFNEKPDRKRKAPRSSAPFKTRPTKKRKDLFT